MLEQLLKWDKDIFTYLNGLGVQEYDEFWTMITEISNWIPLFLLFIVIFILKFPKRKAFFNILTVTSVALFITFLTHLIKIWVKRPRPCNDENLNSFIRILKTPIDYSFFSGHASSSFAITTVVFLLLRNKVKWAWIFFIWPLLFSYSRIYVGVHFPLDILVGALIGTISGILFYKVQGRITVPDTW
ncbi:phosphatase PAP2 family protein [Flagellimonas pacifica]|uniref:Undecaprenyl-diphosphatase n=1 Tax=Flagellimonas pacifica TaxID=1247520 RepID=A0A285MXG4_9FLAO|nr:phosphatase PAP2 family protein [Allomuricauda parva]SNZ01900.1 undecaprenyl-diphosphatase [Allomuricauda parva]